MAREKQQQQRAEETKKTTCLVELPLVEDLDGGLIVRVDVPLHYSEQRSALCRLRKALEQRGAKLKNGNPVTSHPDAIRYLLEQYEAGFDASRAA